MKLYKVKVVSARGEVDMFVDVDSLAFMDGILHINVLEGARHRYVTANLLGWTVEDEDQDD